MRDEVGTTTRWRVGCRVARDGSQIREPTRYRVVVLTLFGRDTQHSPHLDATSRG